MYNNEHNENVIIKKEIICTSEYLEVLVQTEFTLFT